MVIDHIGGGTATLQQIMHAAAGRDLSGDQIAELAVELAKKASTAAQHLIGDPMHDEPTSGGPTERLQAGWSQATRQTVAHRLRRPDRVNDRALGETGTSGGRGDGSEAAR